MKSLIISLVFLGVLSGCSQKQDSASLTIAFPDWKALESRHAAEVANSTTNGKKGVATPATKSVSAQSTQTLVSRIMINVSASDMSAPTVFIWDLKSLPRPAGGGYPSPPTSVTLDVKRGSGRLFQALALVETLDESGDEAGPMTFYYGDVTKAISGDDSSDTVNLTLASQGASVSEGTIAGRMLNADGTGPTGKVNMYYAPPGRPEMIVDQSQTMFSGFFRIFVPSNVLFSYRLASGQTLFERVNASTFSVLAGNTSVVKIEVPAGYRERSDGRRATSARTKIVGFFGPGSSSLKTVCYPGDPGPLDGFYVDSVSATRVVWNPGSLLSSEARVRAGGLAAVDGVCLSGEFGVDQLGISKAGIVSGDSPVGIHGPFREFTAGSDQYISVSHTGTAARVSWRYLRPALGTSVAGVGIMHYLMPAGSSNPIRDRDSLPCSKLTSMGFTEVTRVPFGTTAAPVETYDIAGISAANFQSGRFLTAVCPYSAAGSYYDFGLIDQAFGGGGMPIATKILAKVISASETPSTAISRQKIADNVCTPIYIRTVDASGNMAYRQAPNGAQPQVTVAVTSGNAEFFESSNCSGAPEPSITVPLWGSERGVYIQRTGPPNDVDLTVTDATLGGSPLSPATLYLTTIAATPADRLRSLVATSSINVHQCYPISFIRGKVDGTQLVPQGGSTALASYSSNISAFPGLGFYSDTNCTAPASSAYFMGDLTHVQQYVKYSGTGTTVTIEPDASGYGLISSPLNLSVTQTGPVSQLRLDVPSSVPAENCTPVLLRLFDSQNRPSVMPVGGGFTATLTSAPLLTGAGEGFFSDPACAAGVSASVDVLPGQPLSTTIYFRAMTPKSLNLNVTAPGFTVPSKTVTVGPVQAARIVARVSGVSYVSPGVYTGKGKQAIFNVTPGQAGSFLLQLEARSSLDTLVTDFNDMDLGPAGMALTPSTGTISCIGLSWMGGIGTAQCSIASVLDYAFVGFSTAGKYLFESAPELFFISKSGNSETTVLHTFGGVYAANQCQPIVIKRRDVVYGFPTLLGAALTIPTPAGDPMVNGYSAFFSDPACAGGALSSITIPAGSSAALVYLRFSGITPPNGLVLDGGSWTDPITTLAPAYALPALALNHEKYMVTIASQTKVHSCEPMMVTRTNMEGAPVAPATAATATLFADYGSFFTSGDCSGTAIPTVTFLAGESAKLIFFRSSAPQAFNGIVVDDGTYNGGVSVNSSF